jgi:hypothetical protein
MQSSFGAAESTMAIIVQALLFGALVVMLAWAWLNFYFGFL